MSPMEIRLLLHYYAFPVDAPETDGYGSKAMDRLIDRGFIMHAGEPERRFKGTDKLNCYVEALIAMPEPVQRWVCEP